jgi:predicted Zn-dependent protease
LRDRNDLAGAERTLRAGLRLNPKYVAGHRELGDTLKSKGDFVGAELAYAEACRLENVYEDDEGLTEEELRGSADIKAFLAKPDKLIN